MAERDMFRDAQTIKGILYGTGAVAKLKPAWAKSNGIRNGKTKEGKRVYSVIDAKAYVNRVRADREAEALQSDQVRFWQQVVAIAVDDKHDAAQAWSNDHLLTALSESEDNVDTVADVTFD